MIYLNSSAVVKLAITEAETDALSAYLTDHSGHRSTSSELARVEVLRAVWRRSPTALPQAQGVISRRALLRLSRAVVASAASLAPANLRGLDALHLASALRLGSRLTAMVCYDDRLAAAAREMNLPVEAPGT